MKILLSILLVIIFCTPVLSQYTDKEHVILKLEQEWTALLDKKDTTSLKKLWTENYVVNNATGKIVSAQDVLSLLRAGHEFPKVERQAERITFNGDLAVVMGSEIEYAKNGNQRNRRFTNIWRETLDGWTLVARQANGS